MPPLAGICAWGRRLAGAVVFRGIGHGNFAGKGCVDGGRSNPLLWVGDSVAAGGSENLREFAAGPGSSVGAGGDEEDGVYGLVNGRPDAGLRERG